MIYIIIICLIIIGILSVQLIKKKKFEYTTLEVYQNQLKDLNQQLEQEKRTIEIHRQELTELIAQCRAEKEEIKFLQEKEAAMANSLRIAREQYEELTNKKIVEIDKTISERREQREKELNAELQTKKELYEKSLAEIQEQTDEAITELQQAEFDTRTWSNLKIQEYERQANEAQQKIQGIIDTLAQYEKNRQEKLFYTIQLPEEYQEDIEYLLTSVSQKVQHPDIISKLVWAEYVKPNLDETFKRIQIKPESGIYKLTSLIDGKCYIGKSTDVKKRIADHFKAAIGIKSIADQAIHHAILKQGFWNWQIEIIIYSDKDKLNELEKYYIEFFKSQEFGYNKNSGGGG